MRLACVKTLARAGQSAGCYAMLLSGFVQLAQREHPGDVAHAPRLMLCSFRVPGELDEPMPEHRQDSSRPTVAGVDCFCQLVEEGSALCVHGASLLRGRGQHSRRTARWRVGELLMPGLSIGTLARQ